MYAKRVLRIRNRPLEVSCKQVASAMLGGLESMGKCAQFVLLEHTDWIIFKPIGPAHAVRRKMKRVIHSTVRFITPK